MLTAFALVLLAALGCVFLSRARRFRGLAGVVILTSGCACAITLATMHAATAREVPEQSRARVVVTVTSQPVDTASGARVRGVIESVAVDGKNVATSAPVMVYARDARASDIAIGARYEAVARIKKTAPTDRQAALVFVAGAVHERAAPSALQTLANTMRGALRTASADLPGDGGALLSGLAIGDTGRISDTLQQEMTASSLTHLTAVSGANCALVTAGLFLLARMLGLRRGVRIGLAAGGLALFVVLVTPDGSVIRAATMAGIVLIALALSRFSLGIATLASATILLFLTDPWLAVDYGFALSALATAGLLVLARPIARILESILGRKIALVIAVPTAAQLACQPVLLLLSPTLPTYGVIANMLAEPAAPVATVLGLIACLVGPLCPPAAAFLAWLAWIPAAWIAAVAHFFAGLPLASLPWPGGLLGVVLCVSALAGCAVIAFVRRGAIARHRPVLATLAIAVTCGFLGQNIGGVAGPVLARPPNWRYAACDIGQGDAVLIRAGDKIALVDTGREPAKLEACFRMLGVTRIDVLILTHFDDDHVGAAPTIAGMVDTVLIGIPDAKAARTLDPLAATGAHISVVRRGHTVSLGDMQLEVLWPIDGALAGNSASVAIAARVPRPCIARCLDAVFLGDLGENDQNRVLRQGADRIAEVPSAPVVKVAHHGSRDQSAAMYDRIRATVGLVSVGADNGYGHPTQHAIDMLASVGTTVERTDRQGTIVVGESPTGEPRVWSERSPPSS